MTDLLKLILGVLASLFRSRAKLEAENLVLRQQINVLRRRTPKRPDLNNTDRFLFVWLYRWFPSVLEAVAIVRPETIILWHRAGFRAYWRWRSRNRVGRPKVSAELRRVSSSLGVTFNATNEATDYKTTDEFHLETSLRITSRVT